MRHPAIKRRSARGAAEKYDVLTALLALGQHEGGATARLAPRLALLVTARHNWRTGRLAVGLREIARLWAVTERTAKREMAQLRAWGWLSLERPSARGRVAEHALGVERILAASRSVWPAVGPDFALRMAGPDGPEGQGARVVAFPGAAARPEEGPEEGPWGRASAALREEEPSLHAAWLAGLRAGGRHGGCLTLTAPGAFVAGYVETHHRALILAALRAEDPAITDLRCRPR